MAAPTYKTARQAFFEFRDHLNRLLNTTITDARLVMEILDDDTKAYVGFQQSGQPVHRPIGTRYYLFVGQILQAVRVGKQYRPRTLTYTYRIAEASRFDSEPLFRWEYLSREYEKLDFPRHHLHIRTTMKGETRVFELKDLHTPTGWVTIEEVIRFAITELKIKSKSSDWDKRLQESEQKFRMWTQRST